jgi:hypothetical protein
MTMKPSTRAKYVAAGYSATWKAELKPSFRSHMEYFAAWIWVYGPCQRGQHCRRAIPFYPFIRRYGLDASKPVLDRVLRCAECGKPPMSHQMPPSRGKGDPHVIPIDWVPEGLRGYALIDPLHWPAPLRGEKSRDAL